MKPASFDYVRPRTIAEALAAVSDGSPGARILAGGQSLVPMLNLRLSSATLLVDIKQDVCGDSRALTTWQTLRQPTDRSHHPIKTTNRAAEPPTERVGGDAAASAGNRRGWRRAALRQPLATIVTIDDPG